MKYSPINLSEKFTMIDELWSPKVVAQFNNYQIKLAKIDGDFIWHQHSQTDEVFVVVEGTMDIEFRDGVVTLSEGEIFVVPKGVEHRPVAKTACRVMLIEPNGVLNTGETVGKLTAENDVWI